MQKSVKPFHQFLSPDSGTKKLPPLDSKPQSLGAKSFLEFLNQQATPEDTSANGETSKKSKEVPSDINEKRPPRLTRSLDTETFIRAWEVLVDQTKEALFKEIGKLKALNPSRREAVLKQLHKNASPQSQKPLEEWVELALSGTLPQRESQKLSDYFEEVSRITLAQSLLLKRWLEISNHGAMFTREKLSKLNYELALRLKTSVAPLSDGWHITRPSLYSWPTLSPTVGQSAFELLNEVDTTLLPKEILLTLLKRSPTESSTAYRRACRQFVKPTCQAMPIYAPSRARKLYFFSPTLRDGAWLPQPSQQIEFVGFEEDLYSLLIGELILLWDGPSTQIPLWAQGLGFESLRQDQLSWTPHIHQSATIQKLREFESCDGALVIEETIEKALKAKTPLHMFEPELKTKLLSCSVGTLQALLSLNKLRPKGYLYWLRPAPLSPNDGQEVLSQLLHKANLICEYTFHYTDSHSEIEPKQTMVLYLFQKEIDAEVRLSHRPKRVQVQCFDEKTVSNCVLRALSQILQKSSQSEETPYVPFAQIWTSPTPQHEWLIRWPEHENQSTLDLLDRVQLTAVPLNQCVNLKTVKGAYQASSGIFAVKLSSESNPRKLSICRSFELQSDHSSSGIHLLHADELYLTAISEYLTSDVVTKWLDNHAERKQDKWQLNEATLRLIPIPTAFHSTIKNKKISTHSLHTGWSQVYDLSVYKLARLKERHSLKKLVDETHQVCWAEAIKMISNQGLVSFSQHPEVQLIGTTLPPHVPIIKIDKIRGTHPGFHVFTEAGHQLKITSKNGSLLKILGQLFAPAVYPTWHELVESVRLPRSLQEATHLSQDLVKLAQTLDHKTDVTTSEIQKLIDILVKEEPLRDPS